MTRQCGVQVCDFNLARALKSDTAEPSLTLNSPAWSAPERLQGKRYGKAADVFSFGVILWELITLGDAPSTHFGKKRCDELFLVLYWLQPCKTASFGFMCSTRPSGIQVQVKSC